MTPSRSIVFTLVVLLTVFSAITYFSCAKKDKCNNVICYNKGACDNGSCKCLVGYEGANCEVLSRDKFVSVFHGGDSCTYGFYGDSTAYRQYANSIYFTAEIFKPLELKMSNFLNNVADSAICTMLKVDSFSFLGANNSTTYNGTGWLRQDTLFMQYHVIHDTTSYHCTYWGLRY